MAMILTSGELIDYARQHVIAPGNIERYLQFQIAYSLAVIRETLEADLIARRRAESEGQTSIHLNIPAAVGTIPNFQGVTDDPQVLAAVDGTAKRAGRRRT